jgi:hypothetical protein
LGGPLLSLALGFITYLYLGFSVGAGANTEGTATAEQKHYSSIAEPASAFVAIGGICFRFGWPT